MKSAELPDGKILNFPDDIDEELIDKAVAYELKNSADSEKRMSQRHADMIKVLIQCGQALGEIYKQMHSHTQLLKELLIEQKKHHKESKDHSKEIVKAINTPRKRKAIRNEQGKLEGAEEYV